MLSGRNFPIRKVEYYQMHQLRQVLMRLGDAPNWRGKALHLSTMKFSYSPLKKNTIKSIIVVKYFYILTIKNIHIHL